MKKWKQIAGSSAFLAGLWVLLFFSMLFVGRALWWSARIGMGIIAVVLLFRAVRYAIRKPRYFLFALVIVAFNWMIIELACLVFERGYLARHPLYGRGSHLTLTENQRSKAESLIADAGTFYRFDSKLGWSIKPNGNNGNYRANSLGIRGDREYGKAIPEGVTRVVCCGDSYTFCAEVKNGETWEEYAEAQGALEFLNIGVAGAGLTQAYLRYGELGSRFDADYVFIGFMTNNIQRTINVFRPFLFQETGVVSTKPYAALEDGELVLKPNPLDSLEGYQQLLDDTERVLGELGEEDYYVQRQKEARPLLPSGRVWRYFDGEFGAETYVRMVFNMRGRSRDDFMNFANDYAEGTYPLKVVTRLFDRFVAEVKENGAEPVIVIFPNREDLSGYNEGEPKAHGTLLEHFETKDYPYIDVLDLFAERYGKNIPLETMFMESHYNPETNRLLAEDFVDYVRRAEAAAPGE
jgi:hypothetical protein